MINYTYHPSNNKFCLNKFNSLSDKPTYSNDIKIAVDPHKFSHKSNDWLQHTNHKWFVNLSQSVISQEVSTLLQFGNRFCLPTYINKKYAIHEFIKDIESNNAFHNSNKQTLIRNIAIPQLYKFLKNTPPIKLSDVKLFHLLNVTKQFCLNNNNIIFTRADKGNITVAIEKNDLYK